MPSILPTDQTTLPQIRSSPMWRISYPWLRNYTRSDTFGLIDRLRINMLLGPTWCRAQVLGRPRLRSPETLLIHPFHWGFSSERILRAVSEHAHYSIRRIRMLIQCTFRLFLLQTKFMHKFEFAQLFLFAGLSLSQNGSKSASKLGQILLCPR